MEKQTQDCVNHPSHYKGKGIEAIEVMEAFDLGFHLGNAVKYILRSGKKNDAIEDLMKASWYIQRAISQERFKQEEKENEERMLGAHPITM